MRGGRGSGSWRAQMKRLEALAGSGDRGSGLTDDVAVGLIVALAHPDRIARRRRSSGSYLLASGTGAALDPRDPGPLAGLERSEEHTSELQSLMRISSAVFCLT